MFILFIVMQCIVIFSSGLSAASTIEKIERVQELLGRDLSDRLELGEILHDFVSFKSN